MPQPNPVADIVIPVAAYHRNRAVEAIDSARHQTAPVNVIVQYDDDGRGAGWARNKGAAQGTAPFLIFLDADDTLHSDFVRQCAQTYRRGAFIYTDWFNPDGEIVRLPDCTTALGWRQHQTFHLVTTLLPRALFERAGGFDEALPALEDTDLYQRLHAAHVCGIRCPEPLVSYRAQYGQRARTMVENGHYEALRDAISARYAGKRMDIMCCGHDVITPLEPGVKQDGDILAITLWNGNRDQRGVVSGRRYKGGWQREIWIDPRDAHTQDSITEQPAFLPVASPEDFTPDIDTVLKLAGVA